MRFPFFKTDLNMSRGFGWSFPDKLLHLRATDSAVLLPFPRWCRSHSVAKVGIGTFVAKLILSVAMVTHLKDRGGEGERVGNSHRALGKRRHTSRLCNLIMYRSPAYLKPTTIQIMPNTLLIILLEHVQICCQQIHQMWYASMHIETALLL